jgi:uncharacterized protein YPO0396
MTPTTGIGGRKKIAGAAVSVSADSARKEKVSVHNWLSAVIAVVAAGALGLYAGRVHRHIIEHIDRQVKHMERISMSDTQDAVNAVVAQLGKAKNEIVEKIADVQAQLDAAQVPTEAVDLSALTEAAQALDDIVPDAPVVEVVPDAPVEEV